MSFLDKVAALLPLLAAADEALPTASLGALRDVGLLRATLPVALGGAGFGVAAAGARDLCRLLILLGRGNLAVARLFEAHVNALLLIQRYGPPALFEAAARDAADGHWFGLWVTDSPEGGVSLGADHILTGCKYFCSGAGLATRAFMTAGEQMCLVNVEGAKILPGKVALAGMKGAVTSAVDVTGLPAVPFGAAGDYLREPVFSAGAWRSSAGAVGGLAAVLGLHARAILERKREGHPQQRARFGQAVMAYETANLWIFEAAARACLEDVPAAEVVATVNLARLAIERACLEAMQLAQRSIGLAAFGQGARMEVVCRDLMVFLRQPAPDEVLDIAAAHYFERFAGGFDAIRH